MRKIHIYYEFKFYCFHNFFSTSHYQKIIMLLRHCEYSMTKNHLSYLMNIQERRNYETLYKHIGMFLVKTIILSELL